MENNRNTLIVIAIVLVAAFFVMPWGGQWGGFCGMMGNYGSSYNYNSGWGMMQGFGFGWIFMIIILVALVLLITWLVQQLQKPKHVTSIENSRRRR